MVPLRRLSQRARRSFENHTSSSSTAQHRQPSPSHQHLLHQNNHNYQKPHLPDPSNSFEWHDDRDKYIMTFPIHPLPAMQAPFEESMLDATGETGFIPFPNPNKSIEARQQLLCKDGDASELSWNFTYNCHWRNHSKGKFHPLLKTVAQIVFGVHLLHQHLEKSVADVADILLKHVNELDSFLQRANEDIEGSLKDMLFRRKCLKVPMEHVNEFDRLLEDRVYRAQLLDGNVTIERTITRMSEMLNDYLIDMSTFRDANRELDLYLLQIGDEWAYQNEDVGRIYSAMCGNTGGWSQFLQSLVAKAERLGVVLVQVSSYCNEIEKRCGAASRRSLIASRSSSRNSSNSREAARSFRNFANNKPLPSTPNERPPFIPSPSNGTGDNTTNADAPQRHPSTRRAPSEQAQVRVVTNSDSGESLEPDDHPVASRPRARDTQRSMEVPISYIEDQDAMQLPIPTSTEPDLHNNNLAYTDEKEVVVHHPYHHHHHQQPELSSRSDSDTTETMTPKHVAAGAINHGEFGDQSPPMTGKDSAYSSLSGASFGSPTSAVPRSASSVSSHPRAQFGLFPSSSPGTPRTTVTGRHGSMSPAFASPLRTTAPTTPVEMPERAQTSLDNYSSSSSHPSRRLSKRASLTSIKRFFSKKKHGSVDTITE